MLPAASSMHSLFCPLYLAWKSAYEQFRNARIDDEKARHIKRQIPQISKYRKQRRQRPAPFGSEKPVEMAAPKPAGLSPTAGWNSNHTLTRPGVTAL
jgi:hypothetical protein